LAKAKFIENLFDYILKFSYLLPLIAFLIFHKKIGYDKRVVIILVYSAVIFLALYIFPIIPRQYKLLYQGTFTLIEYITFATIFLYSIERKGFKKIIIVLSLCFAIFQVIFIFNSNKSHLDSVPVAIEAILIFLYCFYFLYQEFKKENQLLLRNSMFWISIGIFFYLAGSFFFFVLANHMTSAELEQYWSYSYLFDVIKNILLTVGLLIYKQKEGLKAMPYLDMDLERTINQ
jgi:hypothetical protein